MAGLSRRELMAGMAAAGVAGVVAPTATAEATMDTAPMDTAFGPAVVKPGDKRYESLLRGNNFRFVGSPDEIRVVGSTDQVVRAVGDAVRAGKRPAVRSGGHCFEDFTANSQVKMLLDMSPMNDVSYDPGRRAFAVQPGATLGEVYKALFKGWGVTIPAGGCPEVGAGGHFAGGGYGPLSRRYGSVVDHLYAVEVVVVGPDGNARAVVATSEPNDPNRELWWAHTGGGGGNFGVVTKYWLRSQGANGSDPATLLPPAPEKMLLGVVGWSWDGMSEKDFTKIVRNFGVWHERNSAPGSPYAGLYPILGPSHRSAGTFSMIVQADAGLPNVTGLVTDLATAVIGDTRPAFNFTQTMPWLHGVSWPGSGQPGDIITRRFKIKAGYLRRSFTDKQIAAIYKNLTNDTGTGNTGMLMIGYGGQVRAVPPGATATAQRDVILKTEYHAIWGDESDDARNLGWVRNIYRDVYADTGGVPVPNEVTDGSYINYADADLADPALNTSGVPWSTLYYKDNYPRLQRIKARWDPRNVFQHALSIKPA